MGVLEFLPAPRRVLRMLAEKPADFAEEHGVRLHEVSRTVAQHSLEFVRSFSLETPAHWFGHFAIEGETQEMVGVCSLKGRDDTRCIILRPVVKYQDLVAASNAS